LAVNKRKILESAQKFLQKGALDKALKEYRTLLELDPKDSGARLKLGDIHLRLGDKDEAVAAYLKVAHQFMKDGFDAKAVALFKQIAKLSPEHLDIHVPLAELYQRLGLTSDAMAALQTATEAFQKAGRKREALELLRKAAALDPTNTTSRLKIADLLRQQGMLDEALTEYDEVLLELERSGADDTLASVYERVLEMQPDRHSALLSLGRISLRLGANDRALELAERAAHARPDLVECLELQAEAMQAAKGDSPELEAVYRTLAELHRARGDEGRAREILQRFISSYDLTLSGVEDLGAGMPEESFAGGEVIEGLTQAGRQLRPTPASPAPSPAQGQAAKRPAPATPAAHAPSGAAAQAPAIDADVEQLLAEAGVYLRFGKRDKAIASLEAVLARAPDHAGAREKLASARGGPAAAARAPELVEEAPDQNAATTVFIEEEVEILEVETAVEILEVESESAPAPDEGAASEPEPAPVIASADDSTPEFEFEVELDLSREGALEEEIEAARATPLMAEPDEEPALELTSSSVIETGTLVEEAELEQEPEPVAAEAEPVAAAEPIEEPAETGSPDFELLIEEESLPPLEPVESVTVAEASERDEAPGVVQPVPEFGKTGGVASPQQILEDLEEADFYYQQGLLDEAESVYRRVLESAPTNPQALLRLGEIAHSRGDDPAAGRHDTITHPSDDTTQPGVGDASDAETTLGDDLAHWDDEAQAEEDSHSGQALEAQLGLGADLAAEEEEELETEALQSSPDISVDLEAELDVGEESGEDADDADDSTESAIASPASIDTREISHFDLAAELSDALRLEDTAAGSSGPTAPMEEESLEAIFSEFKKGVSRTLTDADHETHYDLGIAYREMGLLEDAMGEFQIALELPARRLDCLHLLGLCARELKRPQDAIAFFRQALGNGDLPSERRVAIGFDLGIAFEEAGDSAAALEALESVALLEPDFPGLEARLQALRAGRTLSTSAPEESEAPEAAVEVFESFDDLIADAEASLVTGEGAAAAKPSESSKEDDPAPEPPPSTPPRGTSPRRRKVSFG
jgi:tetratricopeptide (TPR) repeat protein